MDKLSRNIKIMRTMRGLTQTDLAVKLHRSVGAVSNWEKGVNLPDADTIEEICKILNVTPNEIFGWEDNPEVTVFLNELNIAIERVKKTKTDRIAEDMLIKSYADKFGKLMNSKDVD